MCRSGGRVEVGVAKLTPSAIRHAHCGRPPGRWCRRATSPAGCTWGCPHNSTPSSDSDRRSRAACRVGRQAFSRCGRTRSANAVAATARHDMMGRSSVCSSYAQSMTRHFTISLPDDVAAYVERTQGNTSAFIAGSPPSEDEGRRTSGRSWAQLGYVVTDDDVESTRSTSGSSSSPISDEQHARESRMASPVRRGRQRRRVNGLVLDTSALLAYASGTSVEPGAMLTLAEEEPGAAAVGARALPRAGAARTGGYPPPQTLLDLLFTEDRDIQVAVYDAATSRPGGTAGGAYPRCRWCRTCRSPRRCSTAAIWSPGSRRP